MWNNSDILMETKTSSSQPMPSPTVDDDDNYSGGNDDNAAPNTPPSLSNPQADAGVTPGFTTLPASDPKEDTRQCPSPTVKAYIRRGTH